MKKDHSFGNTVVAVLSSGDKASDVVDRLTAAGFEVEVLEGEEGIAHLEPDDAGFWGSIKKAASSLGDERRILDQLDSALSAGSFVVSVGLEDRDGKEAVSILRDHGAKYLWKFGDWTFTPIEV